MKQTLLSLIMLASATLANSQNTSPVIGWGNIDTRYPQEKTIQTPLPKTIALEAWRGEKVSAQLVISSLADIGNVTVEVSDLTSGSKVIPASCVTKAFVGYVMTDELNKGGGSNCGYRISTDFDSTLVADIIDHLALSKPVAANTSQPVWLSLKVPADTKAGI